MKIAVVGSKSSGKSTVGKYLETNHDFARIPMAKPLKDMLRAIGLTDEHLEGVFKESACHLLGGKTPRHAMQTLGTEWGRNLIHEDIWLNLWYQQAQKHQRVVADDVRFHNEVERIKQLSGLIVRVRRPEVEGKSAHESEMYATTFKPDIEIWNDGTIDDLLSKIDKEIIEPFISIRDDKRFIGMASSGEGAAQ